MRRALYRTAVALSIVALVTGGTVAYLGYTADRGPADVVRGYLAALADADAPAALGYGRLPDGLHEYLTSAVLAEQQRVAPLRDIGIGDVTGAGSHASVGYRYRLAFAAGTTTVRGRMSLYRDGSAWRLDAVAVPVTVHLDSAADRITFAETGVPDGRILLFPGALPLRLDTGYLNFAPARPSAALGAGRTIMIRVRPSSAAQRALTSAVRQRLSRCVDRPAPRLACPLPSPRYVPGSLHGHTVGPLRLRFAVTPDPAGMIRVDGEVRVRGSYQRLGYDNVARVYHGRLTLPVHASAYAVRPLRLEFGTLR